MDGWHIAVGIAALITFWCLPIGLVRAIAYVTSDTDHTRGMRNLAFTTLGIGLAAAITTLVLAIAVRP